MKLRYNRRSYTIFSPPAMKNGAFNSAARPTRGTAIVGDSAAPTVRATLNTSEQALAFWYNADADSTWRLIKTRQIRLREPVCDLFPPISFSLHVNFMLV